MLSVDRVRRELPQGLGGGCLWVRIPPGVEIGLNLAYRP